MTERVFPLVLVGPSGAGKTTIARDIVERHPDRFIFSLSATTRPPRAGETEGRDYQFVDEERFRSMVAAGELAEFAEVHGRLYGTPLVNLTPPRLGGRTPVLDIDVQGAKQLIQRIREARVIFILPPDPSAWINRLVGRATEAPAEIRRRLMTAIGELEAAPDFREFVVNSRLDEAVAEVLSIVEGVPAGISTLKAEALCGELEAGARAAILEYDPGSRV